MSDSKRCPWCAETIRTEAIKCRHCGSFVEQTALRGLTAPWVRPEQGRMIAGVCAGLAQQFGISVTVLRLAFVLGVIFSGGVVLLLYLALWITMPSRARTAPDSSRPPGRLDAPPGGTLPPDVDRA